MLNGLTLPSGIFAKLAAAASRKIVPIFELLPHESVVVHGIWHTERIEFKLLLFLKGGLPVGTSSTINGMGNSSLTDAK